MNYLTDEQRQKIRGDIYNVTSKDAERVNDQKILFFLKYCENKSVLDLGSIDHHEKNEQSRYWLFGAIKKVASSLVGLDFYENGVKNLKAKGYNIVFGDAQNFKFKQKFEVVTAGDIIEHLENPGNMIGCAKKHLTDNGLLLVATPNPQCWKYVLYLAFKGNLNRINQEHVSWFCAETLRLLGKRYGFEVVEQRYVSRRWWEKIIVLPAQIKHTTILVCFKKVAK